MKSLLDANVLIALLDEAHVRHAVARQWLSENIEAGWASCPLTQLGCIRIMGHARYPSSRPAAQVALRLAAATRTRHHEFWSADLDPVAPGPLEWSTLLSAKHTADLYLLALAVSRGGRLVTFDRHVPVTAVRGATRDNLVVLA